MINNSDDTAELLAFAVLDDNKRLIAERDRLRAVNAELLAATEMAVAALQAVASRVDGERRHYGTPSEVATDVARIANNSLVMVRAAIAKATAGAA